MKYSIIKERDMSTNIQIVKQNADKLFDNDIISALKIGQDAPRVGVRYGDELPLNAPSIGIEEIPTPEHRADSDFNDLYENVVNNIPRESDREEKNKDDENNPKNE